MIAIFKHELASYYKGFTGYIFAAFMLLFTGIYSMAYNLKSLVANFEYPIASLSFLYIIVIPILAMKGLAEERHQKTDQLLYSLPVSMFDVVFGKYLAMLVVLAVPMLIVCVYPLVLSRYGDVNLQVAYANIFAFFLLGAVLIAIGLFVSALSENQIVAAGMCIIVMLLNYFLSDLAEYVSSKESTSFFAFMAVGLLAGLIFYLMTKNSLGALIITFVIEASLLAVFLLKSEVYAGLFPAVVKQLSVFTRYTTFVNGIFDIGAVVYMISVAALFVYLSVQAMDRRRYN